MQSLQVTFARIGSDLQLFRILAENSESAMSVQELAKRTHADHTLLSKHHYSQVEKVLISEFLGIGRILRYLASVDIVEETDEDMYRAAHITKALAVPSLEAGIHHR